jgi:hypothetical protein
MIADGTNQRRPSQIGLRAVVSGSVEIRRDLMVAERGALVST